MTGTKMETTPTQSAAEQEKAQVELKKLIEDFLDPQQQLSYATEYAWEDIYYLAPERVWRFDANAGREVEHVTGHKIAKRQIKGTYYSPQEIEFNKRFLTIEPHASINRAIRQRTAVGNWRIEQKVPEKLISGEQKVERNPNA